MQRLLLRLQKYDITFVYRPGSTLYIADTLSRAYLDEPSSEIDEEVTAHVNLVLKGLSISDPAMQIIKEKTKDDADMQQLKKQITDGWPERKSDVLKQLHPYWTYRDELSHAGDLLMKGDRILIPSSLRKEMMKKLHNSHLGMEKMKQRARQTIFWPGISKEIEDAVSQCAACQEYQNQNPREEMVMSDIPDYPWQIVGTDLFHWDGNDYLLLVDYYSRFTEVECLYSLKSCTVINKMKMIFSRYGIPEIVRSDNGTQYTSREFEEFSKSWQFEHTTSDPLYPRGNALAERSVQTMKKLLMKTKSKGDDPYMALLELRNTPVDSLASPTELLMGRNSRSCVPTIPSKLSANSITPEVFEKRRSKLMQKQKDLYDKHTKNLPVLNSGDNVYLYDEKEKRWKDGKITEKVNDRSYMVEINGRFYRRNRKMLRKAADDIDDTDVQINSTDASNLVTPPNIDQEVVESNDQNAPPVSGSYITRSGRESIPPLRYGNPVQ